MKNYIVALGILSFGFIGCGSGSNTGANNQAVVQNCSQGYYWNANTNSCQVNLQVVPNQNANLYGTQIAPIAPVAAVTPIQPCPAGQYNSGGAGCAVEIAQQGNCSNGQINTSGYGCIEECSECQNQYRYWDEEGNAGCVPAQVSVSSCRSTKVRRGGRVVLVRNGCPNDAEGNYGKQIKKIKLHKDGSIKRVKYFK